MKYDFTKLADRKGQGAAKWRDMYNLNPNVAEGVVPLSVADMEFENPKEIIEGLKKYLDTAVLGYTIPTEGYYEAVIGWMKEKHDWDVERENIVCSPGVVPTLYTAVDAFTEPGDSVLLITPVYYPFYNAVRMHGRNVVTASLLEDNGRYTMDYAVIEEKASLPEVKLLLLCNPHNPVGRVWDEEELRQLGEICKKHGVIVVSDEIHQDLIMPGYKQTVFQTVDPSFKDFSIVCTAPSKTFNLAGMQTSNIVIPNVELRQQFEKYLEKNIGGSFLNILGYEACRLAYSECGEWLEELCQVVRQNSEFVKKFFAENLPQVKVIPLEGTYLQWLDFRELNVDYKKLEEIHINKAEVFFDEGYVFGKEGECFERLNLACPQYVIEDALKRLVQAYKQEGII